MQYFQSYVGPIRSLESPMQAAVMEMLGMNESIPTLDPRIICPQLMRAFSNFVNGVPLYALGSAPKLHPSAYLHVWYTIQGYGGFIEEQIDEEDVHPGLFRDVPRKKRTNSNSWKQVRSQKCFCVVERPRFYA
jgi:hypothetical protein